MEKRKISYFIVFMNICMSKSSLSWRNSIDSFARRTHILSHNWTNFILNCLNYSLLLISLYFCVSPAICVRGGGDYQHTWHGEPVSILACVHACMKAWGCWLKLSHRHLQHTRPINYDRCIYAFFFFFNRVCIYHL